MKFFTSIKDKHLFILLSISFVCSCASVQSSPPPTYNYKYTYHPLTDDYKVTVESVTFDSWTNEKSFFICLKRTLKKDNSIDGYFNIVFFSPHSKRYQSGAGKSDLVKTLYEKNGQSFMRHQSRHQSGWWTQNSCEKKGKWPFEAIKVSATKQTKIALQNDENIVYAYKNDSLVTLSYLSRYHFLHGKDNFTIDLSKSIAFKLQKRHLVSIQQPKPKKKKPEKNTTLKRAPIKFSILKTLGFVGGVIIITPVVLLNCDWSNPEESCFPR